MNAGHGTRDAPAGQWDTGQPPARDTGHGTLPRDSGTRDIATGQHAVGHGTRDADERDTGRRAADDRQLTGPLAAEKLGIDPQTWRSYRTRPPKGNPVPPPDGWFDGRTPWWWESTIDDWQARRPGAGARTDLKKPESKNDTPE